MKYKLLMGCALLSWAGSASAYSYQQCDGYGTPTRTGDGMTKEATALFGLIGTLGSAGNTRRATPALGATGIAACDWALADARLIDKHWLRRASLLRARAVHDLAESRPDEALKDLDRAVAAIRQSDDPFVRRSMLLGVEFIRGYALALKGDRKSATRFIEEAQAQRPFDRHIALAALAILGDDRAVINQASLAQSVARLDPRLIDILFQSAFDRNEFEAVVILHPHLRAPTRTGDIGVSRAEERVQDAKKDIEELKFAAERSGRLAYALAALGKPAEAKAALDAARGKLAADTPAIIPPPPAGEKEGSKARLKRDINSYVIRASFAAGESLDKWAELVALRTELVGLAPEAAKERVLTTKIPAAGVGFDLLKLMQSKQPGDKELETIIASFETKLNTPAPVTAKEAELVFGALPHTEIAARVNSYRKANSDFIGYFWGGISGFKTLPNSANPNLVTVQFVGEKSSGSVVEEMTLLRAADYAREHGKTGFVILDRRDYQRTVTTTYYGAALRSDPDGYSSSLDIELVDLDRLPERYRQVIWRAIPVTQILSQLGPVYFAAPTAGSAEGN